MFFHLCCSLILCSVFAREYLLGSPVKFIDIYTNYEDTEAVLKNYKETYGANRRNYDVGEDEISTNVVDRIDFHYPDVEFVTRDNGISSEHGHITQDFIDHQEEDEEDRFVLLQSQTISPTDQLVSSEYNNNNNRKPKFQESLSNKYKPIKLSSYIQKVPSKPNKYHNYINNDKNSMNEDPEAITKQRIQMLLKRYLRKIYKMKYNTTENTPTVSTNHVDKDPIAPDTKYLDYGSAATLWNLKNKTLNKINNFLNVFTIIKFNNTQCNVSGSASGSYLGVCYTAGECKNLGGEAMGNCASGYGVCCVFRSSCGSSSSQNCSYFESPNYPNYYPSDGAIIVPTTPNPSPTPDPRLTWYFTKEMPDIDPEIRQQQSLIDDNSLACTFSISKTNPWVNRLRIDFIDFELAGPTNGTCTVERLVISGQNVNDRIPDICGFNTGQHIYVDVSTVNGPIRLSVLSTMSFSKRFKIRICQYAETCLEPTSNCLQYYTGITGVISTFNYDQAAMLNRSVPGYLNNLNYAICIRREAGYCSITYTNVRGGLEYPFQLRNQISGMSAVPAGQAGAGAMDCPDDYIVIDGIRICGDKFNDGTLNGNPTMNAPVTDTNAGPIVVPVRTNGNVTGIGFKLFYTQNPCP